MLYKVFYYSEGCRECYTQSQIQTALHLLVTWIHVFTIWFDMHTPWPIATDTQGLISRV